MTPPQKPSLPAAPPAAGQVKRVRKQVIAQQNAGPVAPARIDGLHMPAHGCCIEHVVVHQRGRMNDFDHGGQRMVRGGDAAASLGGQE